LIDQARSGLNPADQRARALLVTQAETAKSKVLQEAGSRPLFDYYLEYIEANRIHWQARHLADHFAFAQAPGGDLKRRGKTRTGKKVAGPLYELLQLGPRFLTRSWVKDWIVRERQDRPTRLAGSIRVLRSFVRWMNESETYHGLIDPLVVQAREVSRLVPKTGVRTQALEKGQLKAWATAVIALESTLASRALLLLFLTGARMREVLTLRWENIDLLWDVMTIKDKAEGTRRVPITNMVRQLLMELKAINESKNVVRYRTGRIQRDPSPYVFFSERAECGHMTDISVAISKVAKASCIHGWSAHDLRRTYSGLAEWLDLPSGVIAQLQGHKPSATIERHYKPRSMDLLRMHAQRYEDWLVDNSGLSVASTSPASDEDLAASFQPQAA
jgi:integrase